MSNFTFTANSALNNTSLAFQSIVADATAPLGLNISAAYAYTFAVPPTDISGDDNSGTYAFPSGPYTIYGVAYPSITICTNGFVKFGTSFASTFFEQSSDFLTGNPGGTGPTSPLIAVDWEDLYFLGGTGPTAQHVVANEIAPFITEVKWINGQYYPNGSSPVWGNITLTIDVSAGVPIITMDYTAYSPTGAPPEGIVGISDGNIGGAAPDVGADLIVGGSVVPFGPSGLDYVTYFQNFDGTALAGNPAAQPIDVGGTIITWIDNSGFGDWSVF